MINKVLFLFLFGLLAVSAYDKSYEGYELLEVIPRNERGKQAIKYLADMDFELDFWYEGKDSSHIFVPFDKLLFVKEFLTRNEVKVQTINNHVQRDIDEEMNRLLQKKVFDYNDFNTYEDISDELLNIAGRCRTDLGVTCEVYSSGKTSEGRDLWTLKISKTGVGRKSVWVDATIHAREWLATTTHLKIIQRLVDFYPNDADVQHLIDTYDWYLMPVVNADGYAYTWTSDRLWRKNRSPNAGSVCLGTDLNRNFDQKWGNAGASTLACSDTFRGASPASELETQALQNEALRLGTTLVTSIHFHTYSQYWLIPWCSYAADGVSCNYADDNDEMMIPANAAANAIQKTYNTVWTPGNCCEVLYPASGFAMDYFKDVAGVKYTATPELRGNSFIVSKDNIPLSFNEVWNGVLALFEALPQSDV